MSKIPKEIQCIIDALIKFHSNGELDRDIKKFLPEWVSLDIKPNDHQQVLIKMAYPHGISYNVAVYCENNQVFIPFGIDCNEHCHDNNISFDAEIVAWKPLEGFIK